MTKTDIKDEAIINEDESSGKKEKKKNQNSKLIKEIEELKTELKKTKNDYYKAYADAENLKKRLYSEHATIVKYRAQDIALDLLPSIDNLERALAEGDPEDLLVKGIQMVYNQLINSLLKEGIQAIEATNKPFDPNLHHAIISEKVKGTKPGIVVEELQRGYMIKDRILRPSMVKVSE